MKIKSILYICLVLVAGLAACKGKEKVYQAVITTPYGDITVELYNSTPKHRDNFVKLVREGFYTDLLFHRVMDKFMIQGGDPSSRNAAAGVPLGSGGPGYEIDAEVGSPHLRGVLAAARLPNPEKRSSGSQFYIVVGDRVTEDELQRWELVKKIKYNDVQRQIYLEQGGYPSLDMDYTVFGEVVSGMEIVDRIAKVPVDDRNRPLEDVRMTIKLIND
jgi:cyclophilin family peptidyl-prolyl cis-trans isomerase